MIIPLNIKEFASLLWVLFLGLCLSSCGFIKLYPSKIDKPKFRKGDVVLNRSNTRILLKSLARIDFSFIPKKVFKSDGKVSYFYKRREGQDELNQFELDQLISNPPDYSLEKKFINENIANLRNIGVHIFLAKPYIIGASAEWSYQEKTIRISPKVINNGSFTFARVLNHEMIHVAQSCKNGGLSKVPKLIGLTGNSTTKNIINLESFVYDGINKYNSKLEVEAYSNQDNLKLGPSLVYKFC
tara:strand:- start:1415 stop:2140 length:726 start_codon:yes stop_codon:yes gene_type:complete